MSSFEEYGRRYQCVRMTRSDGVLEVTLHTQGDSLIWGAGPHQELPDAFADIGADRDNRGVILTGAGKNFCGERDSSTSGSRNSSEGWDKIYWEGKRLLENLLNIEVPVIAAVNGPARYHAEIAALSDIVLVSDTALFQDKAHFIQDIVPGDGVQVVWQTLLGPNRGKYFLLTGQELTASEAKALGIAAEIHSADRLMDRARQLAREMAAKSPLTLRYTRVVLTQSMKEALLKGVGYGLSLEGLAILGRKSS